MIHLFMILVELAFAVLLTSKLRAAKFYKTMVFLPYIINGVAISYAFSYFFSPINGAFNGILTALHLESLIRNWLSDEKIVNFVLASVSVWRFSGYHVILFMAALASIPNELLEVARLESATPLQTFFYIKIRYLSSTFLFVTIMSLISSFKIFREIYLLTTDYPYDSIYMLQHFMNNKFKRLDYQTLSAAAILMSLVMVVIIGLLFAVENHFGKDVEE